MGFFTAILNNNIAHEETVCTEQRAKYIKKLNNQLEELKANVEDVENNIKEQEKLMMEEVEEIENLKSQVLKEEAELLEKQAAELRRKAENKDTVSDAKTEKVEGKRIDTVVVTPCKEKTKVLPEPEPGENISLTSDDVTLSPSEPLASVVEKPTVKKTTMAAAMTAAMQSGLNKQAQA